MSNFSDTIKKLRKEKGITQAELGRILSISPQAISKWEKGFSEPDTETLRTLSDYFEISVDELLGGDTPIEEEQKEEKKETKIIIGYCDKCKRPIEQNEHYNVHHHGRSSVQHIYCDKCEKERQENIKMAERIERNTALRRGLIWGIVSAVVLFIIMFIVFAKQGNYGKAVLFGFIFAYIGISFVSQLFWGDWIIAILAFFSKSFRMPGVIFELSLDGIISLIFVKLLLGALGWVLSTMIFLVGVSIACACSVFTFPFALPKCIRERNSI